MKKYCRSIFCFFLFSLFLCINVKALESEDYESEAFKAQSEAIGVFNNNNNESNYYLTDSDVYLMAKVVFAESSSEPYEGKVAVASVILNRLNHPEFPKTVNEVIKQKNAFSCLIKGELKVVPDVSSYKAVYDALKGIDPTSEALFYYNPKIATSSWMKNVGKHNIKIIGNHVFFKA